MIKKAATASIYMLAPTVIPVVTAQNIYIRSRGSLIAVRSLILAFLPMKKKNFLHLLYELLYELRFMNRPGSLRSQILHSVLKPSEPEHVFYGVHAQPDKLPEVLHSQILLPDVNAVFL